MNKKATITDVARLAGVGKTTVSRVFNNQELVNVETVDRVMAAARELGYKPSPIARALSSNSSRTISLVVPNVESSTMAEIIRGAMQYLSERDYSLLILDSSENYDKERDYFYLLQERMTDGVIFCHGSAKGRMEALRDLMPVVFVESQPERSDIDRVLVDGVGAFRCLFSYLLDQGFREDEIAIVYGKDDSFSRLRLKQCEQVLGEMNINLNPDNVLFSNWRAEDGYESMKSLLRQQTKQIKATNNSNHPKVVIYLSDVMALGGMRAVYDAGLSVPGDVSVVGFNDARFSAFYQPSLTTLDYRPEQLGIAAARQILNRLRSPELSVQVDVLSTELLVNESVRIKKNI